MIRSGLFFALFFSTLPSFAASFCVQTFNAYTPAYASGIWDRLDRTGDALLSEPCDALQFQELWKASHFEAIKTKLSPARYAMVQADSLRRDKAIIGLASGFKGSIAQSFSEIFRVNNEGGFLDWIRDLNGVQKGFTVLETKLDAAESSILFVNLHTHPSEEIIRAAQLMQMVDYLYYRRTNSASLPMVLTGDLNATPDSLEVRMLRTLLRLRDSFLEANSSYEKICTYCGSNPLSWSSEDRVIDFIFVRSSAKQSLQVKSSLVNLQGEQNAPLSDHFGVRSYLDMQARESSLLPENDPIVLQRVAKAEKTLLKLTQMFSATRDRTYAPVQEITQKLLRDLKSNPMPDALAEVFRAQE